ncbi:hypothetical protein SAMN02910265_01631 [Ruminococcus flavefaciens]|uniref:Class I SAM-dependent DNA methyltransferase n=1 Tax=Ruminococcus flavefaciens TaxID=1265 RepID=A0A1H6JCK6_RUMFL|nr:hypothetical protein [Ruminococcus flavefaciens]SEH59926.1 hypothetical protein SAMN02910265_01631 [Ruminococcus flavefaciens]
MSKLISDKFKDWEKVCNERFDKLKENEEKLNSYFISAYGLEAEITPEVKDEDITVRRADLQREIKSLISYAVGCIFGRYSLDREGLCYAGGSWDSSAYSTIIPCEDNIMTINSADSGLTAAVISFVEKAYGKETLEENLSFIAETLGGSGDGREVIHNYLRKSFFKEHNQIYRNRPIYWQFTSGNKKTFKAIMYIHRYTPDTLWVLEEKYAVPYYEQLKYRLSQRNEEYRSANGKEKTAFRRNICRTQALITEMEGFIQRLHLLAAEKISLELDYGVKINYEKLKDILE